MKEKTNIDSTSMAHIAESYSPKPINVEDVQLPESLIALTEAIAENTHEGWSKARKDQGWKYGPSRDDSKKEHPDLLPYSYLTDEEKEYDRVTAMNAIKLIVKLGYSIHKDE